MGAALLGLAAGTVLWVSVGLVYGLTAEYGLDNVVVGVVEGVVVGVVVGGLLWSAVRLAGGRPGVLGVLGGLGAVVLVAASGMVIASRVGAREFNEGQARASTACSQDRVAALTELGLPNTASEPRGARDGSCSNAFAVPGTQAQVQAHVDDQLRALGWVLTDPQAGPGQHYRRGDLRLTLQNEGDLDRSSDNTITMVNVIIT